MTAVQTGHLRQATHQHRHTQKQRTVTGKEGPHFLKRAIAAFSSTSSWSSNGTRMRACTYVCICAYMCVCVCVCVCVFGGGGGINLKCPPHWHVHISVHSVICLCTHAHTHTCMHTHTHMHAHTHTRMHTHTHILVTFEDSELMGLKVDVAKKSSSTER